MKDTFLENDKNRDITVVYYAKNNIEYQKKFGTNIDTRIQNVTKIIKN